MMFQNLGTSFIDYLLIFSSWLGDQNMYNIKIGSEEWEYDCSQSKKSSKVDI